VSDHNDDQLVTDYLRRLTMAASALPADRRAELTEEITAHIAEARAAGSDSLGGSPSVPDILERLGDPDRIVQAAAEPFPGGGHPGLQRPGVPASVRNAVRLMYVGAAVSLTKVIVDLATEGTTRTAMLSALKIGARKSGGALPTASQFNTGVTATLAMAAGLGLIGVGLWVFVARGSRNGRDWARATGSVLFGLDTLALLIGPPDIGIRGPEATVARIFAGIVWLIGLTAVVFLWQKDSGVFFKVPRSEVTTRSGSEEIRQQ
jgi:uncharacterized membrane protein